MMKLLKSDAALIAVLTLLLFAFVKYQDVSAAPLSNVEPPSSAVSTL